MSKPTPGPWAVDARAALRVLAGDDVTVCSTGCSVSQRDAWEANANLIAAAPDLLAALKALLAVAPAKAPAAGLIVGIEEQHAAAIAAARAAIAKAEGSQS
jgi:hypothetical protein